MKIIIASTRIPKVNGVKKAVQKLSALYAYDAASVQYEMFEGKSGVSDTPMSVDESLRGAKQRALSVFRPLELEKVFSVGVEGGLFEFEGKVFLQSWSCVYDGVVFHFGSSGSIELPSSLAAEMIHRKIELGIAIDEFAKQADVRSKQGTFGILTNDLITREDSFELATTFALIPFLNRGIY
jgi:inosine/xanthosine triphosphatase